MTAWPVRVGSPRPPARAFFALCASSKTTTPSLPSHLQNLTRSASSSAPKKVGSKQRVRLLCARSGAYPDFYNATLQNIHYLRGLYTTEEPPAALIEVINCISLELIKHLAKHPDAMRRIQPRQFEELIAELLASFGWEVQLTPPTKDGGYDIFAISKDLAGVKTSWIIECKKYSEDHKVGVEIARSLYGVKLDLRVANAMLATTSHFTKGVQAFKSSRYDFEVRDYEGVLEWINSYHPHPEGRLYVHNNALKIG
jgi:HJR/Mrr/RecB family endonuclease